MTGLELKLSLCNTFFWYLFSLKYISNANGNVNANMSINLWSGIVCQYSMKLSQYLPFITCSVGAFVLLVISNFLHCWHFHVLQALCILQWCHSAISTLMMHLMPTDAIPVPGYCMLWCDCWCRCAISTVILHFCSCSAGRYRCAFGLFCCYCITVFDGHSSTCCW